jgi:5-methylcytosine-specific restriction endonuclease McrA
MIRAAEAAPAGGIFLTVCHFSTCAILSRKTPPIRAKSVGGCCFFLPGVITMPNRKHAGPCASRAEGARRFSSGFKFEFKAYHRNITDSEMIADLRRVARQLGTKTLTKAAYRSQSKYGDHTVFTRFGSWENALKKAGLTLSRQYNVPVVALFENMEFVWRSLGHQPTRGDMRRPLSKYSTNPYENRFGGFQNAAKAFIKWKAKNRNRKSPAPPPGHLVRKLVHQHTTGRKVNARLRYLVLRRDHFTCRACGRSPATHRNVHLQVDHIKPWSAGGETVAKNLQTLCRQCNLGKSNL